MERRRRGTVSSSVPKRLIGPKATPDCPDRRPGARRRSAPARRGRGRRGRSPPGRPRLSAAAPRAAVVRAAKLAARVARLASEPPRSPRSTSTAIRARVASIATVPPPGRGKTVSSASASAVSAVARATPPVMASAREATPASSSWMLGAGVTSRGGPSPSPTSRSDAPLPARGSLRISNPHGLAFDQPVHVGPQVEHAVRPPRPGR